MRIGQALGLRHNDFVSHRRELRIVPRRDNTNGARAKTVDEHTIPISAGPAVQRLQMRKERLHRTDRFTGRAEHRPRLRPVPHQHPLHPHPDPSTPCDNLIWPRRARANFSGRCNAVVSLLTREV